MDKKSAIHLIEDTFNARFDESRFTLFIKNLLNDVEPKSNAYSGNYIWDDHKEHINTYKRIGKYIDPEGDALDVLIVEVKSVDELLNFYDKLDYLIGGRMHSMIIAHTNLLPHIGVIWQDKIIGFGHLTKAEDRMYTVETLKLKRIQIAGEIRSACRDEKLVSQMDKINQHLREIVAEGNILP